MVYVYLVCVGISWGHLFEIALPPVVSVLLRDPQVVFFQELLSRFFAPISFLRIFLVRYRTVESWRVKIVPRWGIVGTKHIAMACPGFKDMSRSRAPRHRDLTHLGPFFHSPRPFLGM